MNGQIITVGEVTKQFRDGTRALDGLSLTIPAGDCSAPTAREETTLIRILAPCRGPTPARFE